MTNNKNILKFITCGSVDDGKSTLIGRILFESQLILDDQLEVLRNDSMKVGTPVSYTHLTLPTSHLV